MGITANSFVIGDSKQCVGCKACEMACFKAHSSEVATVGSITTAVEARLHVVINDKFAVPVQCRHCENAPCASVCPIGAIKKENNSIIINEEICIGCKACVTACPIGAIEMISQCEDEIGNAKKVEKDKKIAIKCDLCKDKEEQACIKACPKGALKLFDVIKEKQLKNVKTASSM